MKNSINSRIDPNLIIDEELFSLGLVFVTKYLCEPLKEFMEKDFPTFVLYNIIVQLYCKTM